MRAEGVLRESDSVRAEYLNLRPRPAFAVLGVLLYALFVWVFIAKPSWGMALAVAFFPLWLLVYIPWQAKKIYRQRHTSLVPTSIEVLDEGLLLGKWGNKAVVPWPLIQNWRYSRKLVLLYFGSGLIELIPHHFFSTREAYMEFVKVLKDRAGDPT